MRETISTREASELTEIGRFVLYRLARDRVAPPSTHFYLGRSLRWRRSGLLHWLANGGSRLADDARDEQPAGAA